MSSGSAKGAEYESQGQARSASPLVNKLKKSLVALKGRNTSVSISAFQASSLSAYGNQGQARSASPLVANQNFDSALNRAEYISAFQASVG